jgi:hypothetical protein
MNARPLLALAVLVTTGAQAEWQFPTTGGSYDSSVIEQECSAMSFELAKHSCFEVAIEKVAGQVIVMEREAVGSRITKHNIGQYSAGYVNDYDILEQSQDAKGNWHLKMRISISSSKIAHSKLPVPIDYNSIDGEKELDIVQSKIEQRMDGDGLLASVLDTYPEHAYVVNSNHTEIKVTKLRSAVYKIPYHIEMNSKWIEAFNEAADLVSVDKGQCSTITQSRPIAKRYLCPQNPDLRVFTPGVFMTTANSYYLPDAYTLELINDYLRPDPIGQQHIGLRVDMMDHNGRVFDSRCAKINNELFVHYSKPKGTYNLNALHEQSRPNLMGQNQVHGVLQLELRDREQVRSLNKVSLTVQSSCT